MWQWAQERDVVLTLVVLVAAVLLVIMPDIFESPYAQDVTRVRARVIKVDNSNIQQFGIVRSGEQLLQVEVLAKEYEGMIVEANNMLLGKMETDKMFLPGDIAYVVLEFRGGQFFAATAYDHYRLDTEALLVAIFAVLLIAFAGWSGIRALLSFVFALLMLWRVLLPGILVGWNPVLIALGVVMIIAAVTLTLVAGWNRVSLTAFIGSLLGMVVTSLLAFLLLEPFNLHGAIQPFSETLLYSGFEWLNLTQVFLAAVFIGASGAVIDVAIDVATSMNEVIEKRPDLSIRALIRSGFAVGRNMTSTMVTTLLMAYASSYIALLMVFLAQGIPPANALNTNYVAAEVMRTVVGSFGLVTVAPFTALVGGLVFKWGHQHSVAQEPVLFHVQAARCALQVGDEVEPDSVLGEDVETGFDAVAGLHGQIVGIHFDQDDHALVVAVKPQAV